MLFSVVICTYNRTALLAVALDSVLAQTYPRDDFEIIIVDNNSSDQTAQVVWQRMDGNPHVRYECEMQQGLASARNRGWQTARGQYVAYLDDDAIAAEDWLAQAKMVLEEHPALDAFGGPYYAYYNVPKPDWFLDRYGSWELAARGCLLGPDDYLCGDNLFIHRALFDMIGGFDPGLGMKGNQLAYGEETDWLRRLLRVYPAAQVYYAPAVRIRHLVRPPKMRLGYQLKLRFNEGRYGYMTFSDGRHTVSSRHIMGLFVLPLITLFQASIGVLVRDRRQYPYWQNYYYEVVLGYGVSKLGKVVQRISSVWKGQ